MRIGRSILMVVIAVALAAYGFDCSAAATPDEAMRCCEAMPCSSHGHHHNQDCCKTMPSTHSPFVQSLSMHSSHTALELCGLVMVASISHSVDFSAQTLVGARSHAPPISQSTVISPLRI